eukprot:TRINITY_DN3632_c0_g1_i1.p1 TRINITY_DN3632_c0_g1~~TRINITY_DN3632_c0_g1_i1.p1  ORF type:complete len:691 (+),score=134.41 TRINITY_DN3632_c0_g1_i1:89-2161(+)
MAKASTGALLAFYVLNLHGSEGARAKAGEEGAEPNNDYCLSQDGTKFGQSCSCNNGKVCLKGGQYGCFPGRQEISKFSFADELGDKPECVEDPCYHLHAKMTLLQHIAGTDDIWGCQCRGESAWCVAGDGQPCPQAGGLTGTKEFIPAGADEACEDCSCRISARPPKRNFKQEFAALCETQGGEAFGTACSCQAVKDKGAPRKCKSMDGLFGCGENHENIDSFTIDDCKRGDDGEILDCPVCVKDTCRLAKGELIRGDKFDDLLIQNGYEGWMCMCGDDKLCLGPEGQPGCPNKKVKEFRWQFGFEMECEDCKCIVANTYEQSMYAQKFDRSRGRRFIYPQEDLCAEQGGFLDYESSSAEGGVLCSCAEWKQCVGEDCVTASSFEPLLLGKAAWATCKTVCSDPPLVEFGTWMRPPSTESGEEAEEASRATVGQTRNLQCAPGYMVKAGTAVTITCMDDGKFSAAGRCVEAFPCPSSCKTCEGPQERWIHVTGGGDIAEVCTSCKDEFYTTPSGSNPGRCQYKSDLLGEAFVLATTQGKKPTEFLYEILEISAGGPTSGLSLRLQVFKAYDDKKGGDNKGLKARSEPFDLSCACPDHLKQGDECRRKTELSCKGAYEYQHRRSVFSALLHHTADKRDITISLKTFPLKPGVLLAQLTEVPVAASNDMKIYKDEELRLCDESCMEKYGKLE